MAPSPISTVSGTLDSNTFSMASLISIFNHEEFIITNEAQIPALIMNPIEGVNTLSVDFNG